MIVLLPVKKLILGKITVDAIYNKVFPDIIIHKRGTNEKNYCIIELKKSTNTSTVSIQYDHAKLKAYTTEYYGNELNYNLGVFILIKTGNEFQKGKYKENYELDFYSKGEIFSI